ncbi:hypothetical protein GF336_02980 [Candidatus Woesearchaeota archaeon]|nr:hypothetical protein [Candidatus Woesearchaeota archaeon]
MAEKKEDHYKNIEKSMKTAKKYVSKVQDRNYAAIKKANEAIDYDFDKLEDSNVQDKYIKTVSDEVREDVKKHFDLGKNIDERLVDTLVETLGGITYEEIKKIVKGSGKEFGPDELVSELERKKNDFAQRHYAGIANKYVTEKEHIEPALKYLGIEGKVQKEKVTPEHMPRLFAYHGTSGELHKSHIPHEIRKGKKKDKKKAA